MTRKMLQIAVLLIFVCALSAAAADDTKGNQTTCPIMGNKIDPKVYVDYKDNRIFFCCPSCEPAFMKDPEGTLKKMADEGVTVMKLKPQSVCPITGEALTGKGTYFDFEGKRIYTCCANCIAAVEKDPKKALKAIADRGEYVESAPASN